MRKDYYVYIITNKYNCIFYIGVTNDINRRHSEHFLKDKESFSKKYNLHKVVYVEHFYEINEAIYREKQLKNWKRNWKIELIKKHNPNFDDLTKGDSESSSE